MKIGMIDADLLTLKHGNNAFFPNLALMKLSAWHKAKGDSVRWYEGGIISGHMDKVYVSKVFSFADTPDLYIDADEVEYGGSGFAIELVNGKEIYHKDKDKPMPYEIEHIYPDYSLYPQIKDTAYGFLSRGCP